MITFQQEDMYAFLHQAQALTKAHEQEINDAKERQSMDLDVQAYDELERAGKLLILTVKDEGKLIGYAVLIIRRHGHYALRCAFEDAHYLDAEYRRQGLGTEMVQEIEKRLKALNVKRAFWHVKPYSDHSQLFEKLGYSHSDTILSKWI